MPDESPTADAVCTGLGALPERLILTRSLGALHQAARDRLHVGEALHFPANLAFSDAAVTRVLREARACGDDVRVILESPVLSHIAALTGEHPVFHYQRSPSSPSAAAQEHTQRILVKETTLPGFNLPTGPLTVVDEWAIPVGHWAQLLWANLLGLGPALWQALGAGVTGAARLTWAAMYSGSLAPYRMAQHVNTFGKGCQVHPNATVEGSVIGAGVHIGAGAVVRGCIVGEGAHIEDLALVEGSVLGARACVQRLAMVKYSLVEDRAFAAGIQQLAVIGAGATVKHGAVLMDQAFGRAVRVRVPRRKGEDLGEDLGEDIGEDLRDAPHGMIGVCVGPGAVIGSGVRIAAGRTVAPGLTLVADPDTIVSRTDLPAGTRIAYAAHGGLVPQ